MSDIFSKQQEAGFTANCCGDTEYGRREILSSDETDVIMSRELTELTVQEREKVFEDIHGVAPAPEETPEFVATCLKKMDAALSKIPKSKRKAFDRALYWKPSIQSDKKFKLMFLRADLYDPQKAAQRLVKHYEEKLLLFGENKLAKKLTLDDLGEKDREILNHRGVIILPNKDQTGRPIWFFDLTRFDFEDPDKMFRAFWYQVMVTAEDEDAQLKGVVDLVYCPGDLLANPSFVSNVCSLFIRGGPTRDGLPCRVSTFHFCYSDPRVRYVVSTVGSNFGKHVRLRMRTHYGSDQEIQYSLLTFGIVCDYLFRSAEDDKRRKLLQEQYQYRRRGLERKENELRIQEEQTTGIIRIPQEKDVLVGRGRPNSEFSGNIRLGQILETQLDRYRQATGRFEKTCIFLDVVKTVQEQDEYDKDGSSSSSSSSKSQGGRFLQKISEGWKIASDEVAREKVASALRFRIGKSGEHQQAAGIRPLETNDTSNTTATTATTTLPPRNPKRAKHDSH